MPLAPGSRLGPYEVLSPLGAGGMGEVYRARDTRLNRDVAVKVLPEHLATDPGGRVRFEREAKAISSLNHPHICTLFDVGREAGIDYLVMELVEGETLAARLARGPMPTADVLRLATQIASALEVAHRAGVVHRDLKPGNVMLTRAGAKLMDFGLAKGTGAASSSAAMTAAPTVTSPLTAEGTIVGTFQYMAPEQLEGKEADTRSDLFALGLVIYEMATGRAAFAGKTQASLIAAILKDEPPSIASSQAMSPPALDRLVRLCLRKDPEERIQSAHDVRLRIEEIGETAVPSGTAGTAVPGRPSLRREGIAWGVAALLAIAVASRFFVKPAPPAPLLVSAIPAPPGGSFVQSTIGLALSPDGRSIAYVARSPEGLGLWIRALDGTKTRLVASAADGGCAFWSPDARSIAFGSDGQLRSLDVATGDMTPLAPVTDCFGGSWGADGSILYVPDRYAPIMRIPAPGGQAKPIDIAESSKRQYGHPSLLPDGRHILYSVNDRMGEKGASGIFVATIDGKDERRLLPVMSNARFVAPGFLLFAREGALRAQRFDPVRLELQGEAIPLLDSVQYLGFYMEHVFTVSDNGLLAYIEGDKTLQRQFTWVDRHGTVLGTLGAPGNFFSPRLSHDGRRIAYDLSDSRTDSGDIWVLDLERDISTRLTFDPRNESAPIWSPDDARILFFSNAPGHNDLFSVGADGRGNQETVLSGAADYMPCEWSPDGKSILVQSNGAAGHGAMDLQVVRDGKAETWLASPFTEKQARFSPDGRWISYDSDESGRSEVYVRAASAAGGKWRVSSAGGDSSVWSRDGRELFYLSADSDLMSVSVAPGAQFKGDAPVRLFKIPGEILHLGLVTQYDVTPDGTRFLMNLNKATPGQKLITLVSNWTSLLPR
ncbi:MAG TPA: protein kinase [Candidatus Polarisedimenticolia bacterium]|nr:protein kinase [Candidatus Polarisedimenticolia bacterium]